MYILVYFIIHTIKHTQIYYTKLSKKSIHINTVTNRQDMVPLAVERNVNRGKDAVLNHNCIKVTVTHTYCSAVIILWPPPVGYCGELLLF